MCPCCTVCCARYLHQLGIAKHRSNQQLSLTMPNCRGHKEAIQGAGRKLLDHTAKNGRLMYVQICMAETPRLQGLAS